MNKRLKGGAFENRYLFKGILTALTPFHIGSGGMIERLGMGIPLQISAVVIDNEGKEGKPYIPGSVLRGVLRNWLRRVWCEEDREDGDLKEAVGSDEVDASLVAEKETRMERLFGTIYGEGKVEVWDSPCISEVDTETNINLSGWDKKRLTYVAKSVAINPETGTAEDKKLYNFELVPEGAIFNITVTAQNLCDDEVALILHALEGFNHPSDPVTLGSMTKRGFGRFSFALNNVYCLGRDKIGKWKELAANDDSSGYLSIYREEFKVAETEINLLKALTPATAAVFVKLRKTWSVELQTPLVVRSGGKFGWENASHKKTRNYHMKYRWGKDKDGLDELIDLYFSIKIVGKQLKPYYHVPSSSIRGALRDWTVTHLLPKEWWNIEAGLKNYIKKGGNDKLPRYLDEILLFFGFAVKTGKRAIDKKYNCSGRLTIIVKPFIENGQIPSIDGTWVNNGNIYGPTNAKCHIKPRNPLDRITHAAKETGLHNFLEFSSGQTLNIEIIVESPTDFDKKLTAKWKEEINAGIIRFGALSSIGRGRMQIKEENNV